jgi:hypothetical protein
MNGRARATMIALAAGHVTCLHSAAKMLSNRAVALSIDPHEPVSLLRRWYLSRGDAAAFGTLQPCDQVTRKLKLRMNTDEHG